MTLRGGVLRMTTPSSMAASRFKYRPWIGQRVINPIYRPKKKRTFCLIRFPSSINDDFKRGCVTDDHSFKHGCFPIYIQYLTTALGRILFSSVVMVLAHQPGGPGSNPARIIYFCHAFIHFFLRYELCS